DLPEANPFEYVSKIAEKIGISGRSQRDAVNILKKTRGTEAYKGKDPFGVAAAALYISCIQNNEKKTQRDMAEAAGVTEVTVRNRYKSLKRQLEFYI
ncbi:MAG: transcription initiation factor IIB, partial [Candidatus Aenigmarchaeota archaeon]|nr:transcription initiation factor IIB [Candidatus Aenigmarchaeota archaeon]